MESQISFVIMGGARMSEVNSAAATPPNGDQLAKPSQADSASDCCDGSDMIGPDGWHFVAGLTVTDANRLLDCLQVHGVDEREIKFQPDGYVTVRWKV
jgi:hypothetical protein